MKLGVKYAIAFVIGTFVCLIFVSLLSYALTRNALQKTIIAQQEELSQQTIDSIDRFVSQQLAALSNKAQNETISAFVRNRNASISADVTLVQNIKDSLNRLAQVSGSWDNLLIVGSAGNVLYAQSPITDGAFRTDNDLYEQFQQAQKGLAVYSDVVLGKQTKIPTMIFAAPIRDTTLPGKPVIGVLLGKSSWNEILSLLRSMRADTTELYNSRGLLIGNNKTGSEKLFITTARSSSIIQATKSAKGITTTNELITFVRERGTSSYTGNGWILMMQTPVQAALKLAVSAGLVIAALLLPIIAVVNGVLLYFVLELLRPLLLIDETAEEIAQGNLTKRVPYSGKDEIGKLADSFNKMASSMQSFYEGLEKKVQDKTKELSEKMEDAETMNGFMIKRELKLIEMKKKVAELQQKLSERKA
jgi:HAMP domain-containing protein